MVSSTFAGVAKALKTGWLRSRAAGWRGIPRTLLGALVVSGCVGSSCGGDLPAKVKVVTKRDGVSTRFFVRNAEKSDMTATVEIGAVGLRSDVELPRTVTVPAGETVLAFTLTPIEAAGEWSYSYTNHYTVGRHDAKHDDSVLYLLPYFPGETYKVTQGYHGTFSHTGPDEFAIDWKMPEGTPVLAARAGVVVSVKDHFDKGGPHRKYEDCANLVTVQHEDGTMAHYCHLAPRSAKVTVGERVRAGELLALSGNTGFTSGPHLHFAVFKARDGYGRETIPVKFRTAEASGITLVSGQKYRAIDAAPLASNR